MHRGRRLCQFFLKDSHYNLNLVHLLRKSSGVYHGLADEMKKNSEQIKTTDLNSQSEEDRNIVKYRTQLIFDCSRYLSAFNQILSCIIIPVRDEPPRRLSWRPNPVARNRPAQTPQQTQQNLPQS